jgi:hypothetical protein
MVIDKLVRERMVRVFLLSHDLKFVPPVAS